MMANGEDQVAFVNGVLDKIEDFCGRVRARPARAPTGRGHDPPMHRGGAAAATWICRGGTSPRRRRGRGAG